MQANARREDIHVLGDALDTQAVGGHGGFETTEKGRVVFRVGCLHRPQKANFAAVLFLGGKGSAQEIQGRPQERDIGMRQFHGVSVAEIGGVPYGLVRKATLMRQGSRQSPPDDGRVRVTHGNTFLVGA